MSQSLNKTATNGRVGLGSSLVLPEEKWQSIAESLYLSDRELAVVQGILNGESEAAIARRLGRSSHTIHTHLDRIFRKLQVGSRCELATRIFTEYLSLEPPDRRG